MNICPARTGWGKEEGKTAQTARAACTGLLRGRGVTRQVLRWPSVGSEPAVDPMALLLRSRLGKRTGRRKMAITEKLVRVGDKG